jgi:NTE family protein
VTTVPEKIQLSTSNRIDLGWLTAVRRGARRAKQVFFNEGPRPGTPRIGIALGGGFARAIAHIGVLRVLERNEIPFHAISGVSAGSIVAAAYAAGANTHFIEEIARTMRFRDVARWTISLMGLAHTDRMIPFLGRLLKAGRFEQMRIPLAVVASDIISGKPVVFRGEGDAALAIRASCAYPGLFQPVRHQGYCLVDGYVTTEVPVNPLREMGADHIIAVHLPGPSGGFDPRNLFGVMNRCFQVMGKRLESEWRNHSDLVIAPAVEHLAWDCFTSADEMIELGEKAALAALPTLEQWLGRPLPTMRERFD